MKRDVVFSNNRISQLPMAISGIFYDVVTNGIAMPIFTHTVVRQAQ
ncbi:MAG: RAxF-45 family protein [Tumebacillaceae bacterium]